MNVVLKQLFVDVPTAAKMFGLSESTVHSLIRNADQNGFPRPRKLSGHRVGLSVKELEAWGDNLPVSDFLPPSNTGAKKPRKSMLSPGAQDDQKAA